MVEALRDAGITVDDYGTADREQMLTVQDLVALVGLAESTESASGRELDIPAHEERFEEYGAEGAEQWFGVWPSATLSG